MALYVLNTNLLVKGIEFIVVAHIARSFIKRSNGRIFAISDLAYTIEDRDWFRLRDNI